MKDEFTHMTGNIEAVRASYETLEQLARANPSAFLRLSWFFPHACSITKRTKSGKGIVTHGTKMVFDEEYSYMGFCKSFLTDKDGYECLMEIDAEDVSISWAEDVVFFDVKIFGDYSDFEVEIYSKDDVDSNEIFCEPL